MARMGSQGSERRVRRQFSEEFKAGAVRLVLNEGKTVGAVARELDLTASVLSLWVQHARAEQTKGKSGLMKEEREELARLRKENRILAEERDILKPRPSSRSTAGKVSVHRCGEPITPSRSCAGASKSRRADSMPGAADRNRGAPATIVD